MERLVKGDVVVLPFPFSDLSFSKKRPALVVANLKGDDVILCQITSQTSEEAIPLNEQDFEVGKLPLGSWILPEKIFTADSEIIIYEAGKIKKKKIQQVQNMLCEIFSR